MFSAAAIEIAPFHPSYWQIILNVCILAYMGRVNIYIKKEHEDIWNAIENKSDFIGRALESYSENGLRKVKLPQFDKPIYTQRKNPECKNGHLADDFGRCLDKSCKYGR